MGAEVTKRPEGEPAEIGIVVYPRALMSAIHGLTDMFQVADMQSTEQGGREAPQIRVSHWKLQDDGTVSKARDTHSGPSSGLRALILPPTLSDLPVGDRMGGLPAFIREQHGRGTTICSVCGGAYLLAESGLAAGRTITTHWSHQELIGNRYGDLRIDTDKLLIDEGDIITAGGMMAWIDLGLKLVDRFLGTDVMLATARFMIIDPGAREQSYYSVFAPKLDHGDTAILKIQHWLHGTSTKGVTLQMMAERAGLGDRTFLRRFQKATGLNPTEYCQRLRIAKSRDLLERSQLSIEQVAWQSGYEDTNAYRKIFRKILGLSPKEYRLRFSVSDSARGLATATPATVPAL
ncbi:AraC family transcriptional regulator [Ensifer sp. LC13]|nr:AraC family transcriptional regulator [Ensifer sp. LC14]OCP04472.1 AraC family transcriptional regulator [Ensifer sp. LC11]OCP04751.1 AraC family transcriptional regulator [Ensifer sp. LC13]OCP30575.1 AraC family transcriptional regulator [Ensifer sp. LC499]